MKLNELLQNVDVIAINADINMEISGVAYDSRKVAPGNVFVAINGIVSDGNRFIPMAVENGASAVASAVRSSAEIPYILVRNDRLALAQMAANFYGHPVKSMKLIGVTGTNGKTSVTLLLKHVLERVLGVRVGLIGTMSNMIGSETIPAEHTTPESLDMQELFAKMYFSGCQYVIMEVSSHAIALERIGGIEFDVAAFTNLTEDHLDFHKTMEAYCDTKAELFRRCRAAVANADDFWFKRICASAAVPMFTISAKTKAELYASDTQFFSNGVCFTAVSGEQQAQVKLQIPGKFAVYNALTALGIAMNLGISLPDAAEALADACGVKGRVEVVPAADMPYTILIDYAHTPDGLENVLSSVKDFCEGRLIVVFGCGGDRDPIKRPIMGRIGTEIADIAIITSDNPRTEESMAIIADILKGIDPARKNYEVIENRCSAIHHAMDIAQKNDIIVLAGKGHENYQELNGVKYHLDEREVVAAYLEKMRR